VKKILLMVFIVAGFLLVNTASASLSIQTPASLNIYFVNQDPYPADPGDYVNLLLKLENSGSQDANNVTVQLITAYPFSLDPGISPTNSLGIVKGLGDEMQYQLKYRLKVDNNAVNGDNEIKLKYSFTDINGNFVDAIRTFNITVSNPRTDFGVVVQDSTAGTTTFAIANIGSNNAYSVIATIPPQSNFRTTGVSSSVIGNLNAGDYTLASFQVSSNAVGNATRPENFSMGRGAGNFTGNFTMAENGNLIFDISYTDTLGIRRTVEKEVVMNLNSTFGNGGVTFRTTQGTSSRGISSGMIYMIIGIVGIVAIVLFFVLRKRIKRKK
jgi:hypothetical protein